MLAEISRIPLPNEDSEEVLGAIMEQLKEAEGSVSNQVDQIVTMFNGFQEFMGSVSYPDIAVSPVAIYRAITNQQ